MNNGGQVGMRGYLVQTLIALLDSLESDPSWNSVTIEPAVESDKVDILWETDQGTRAVQVKSSQNPFRKADIERWAKELAEWKQADTYELILVGTPESNVVARIRKVGNVDVPPPKNLDLNAFKEQAAHRLDRVLKMVNLPAGNADQREMLAGALAEKLATLSTTGSRLTRSDLLKQLTDWIPKPEPATASSADHNQVRIIRVYVSSADDVQDERAVVDEVIGTINRTDGVSQRVRLESYNWRDHAVPQIGPGKQKVIAGQIPEHSVYLGLLSTRLDAIMEKEFRGALKKWRQAQTPWIAYYFNAKPPLSSDPVEVEKYLKVCKFRKSLEKQGIVATYAGVRGSAESLYEKLSIHLRQILQSLPRDVPQATTDDSLSSQSNAPKSTKRTSPKATIPADYLRWLQANCADVDLLGLRVQQGQAVKLNNVYVPLTTPTADKDRAGPDETLGKPDEERPVQTLLGLLDRDSLYVAGSPGSGKSTFCRWVAWLACEGQMPPTQIPPPDKYQEQFPAAFVGRFPLLVRLRDFWSYLPHTPNCRDLGECELQTALSAWVDAKKPGGATWSVIEPHLEQGSLLLILDGVDEVPLSQGEAKTLWHPRALLLAGLTAALKPWTDRGNRVLLTSRPYGLSDADLRKLGLPSSLLGDLDQPLRELLVRRWFHCLTERAEDAEAKVKQMLGNIALRQDIQALTANPMLLTAICIVYHQGQQLPHGRYDLYDRIVDNVLYNRFPEDREVIDPVRNRLAVVAYGMHTGDGLGEVRATPQAEVTFAELDRMIQTYQDQTRWKEVSYTSAIEAREQLLTRTGLLLPREQNRAGFYHFTFQDFLCAQRLLDVREEELFEVFRQHGPAPEWRSTLSFVFGAQLARHSSPQRSASLLERLIESLSDDDVVLSVVVGECLQILLKRGVRLPENIDQRFQQYCLSAIEREVPLRERHELALTLGHLGDPRIVTDLRDLAAYVEIPVGTYHVGGDDLRSEFVTAYGEHAKDWTLDEATFQVERPFLLSKHLVTNSQFELFVAAGGYGEQQWWSAEGWKWRAKNQCEEPRFWRDAKWNAPNKPVVGVSYWEAEAFAQWAGGRLPAEREWEATASGPNGLKYPWGDTWEDRICNSNSAELGETSAVGIFPRSRPLNLWLEDMAGDVWEWCADQWGAKYRVIRGGSWRLGTMFCRSASRGWNEPEHRIDHLGFRVAAVPSSRPVQNRRAEPEA